MEKHTHYLALRESAANHMLHKVMTLASTLSEHVVDWLCSHGTHCCDSPSGKPCVFCCSINGCACVPEFQEALNSLEWMLGQVVCIISTNMPGVPKGPPPPNLGVCDKPEADAPKTDTPWERRIQGMNGESGEPS